MRWGIWPGCALKSACNNLHVIAGQPCYDHAPELALVRRWRDSCKAALSERLHLCWKALLRLHLRSGKIETE